MQWRASSWAQQWEPSSLRYCQQKPHRRGVGGCHSWQGWRSDGWASIFAAILLKPRRVRGRSASTAPVREAFRTEWRAILRVAGLNVLNAVGFYMVFVYVVTYLQQVVHVQAARALDINTINMVLLLLLVPVAGGLSDRIGRKPVLVGAALGTFVLAWPLFSDAHPDAADTRRPNGLCRVGWAVPWCRPGDDGRGVSGAGALQARYRSGITCVSGC